MIYSCEEHVEYALEEIVNTYATPPVLQPLKEGELLTTTCGYCGKTAIYVVSNEHSPTKCG